MGWYLSTVAKQAWSPGDMHRVYFQWGVTCQVGVTCQASRQPVKRKHHLMQHLPIQQARRELGHPLSGSWVALPMVYTPRLYMKQ